MVKTEIRVLEEEKATVERDIQHLTEKLLRINERITRSTNRSSTLEHALHEYMKAEQTLTSS